ncbi:hypothetical protein [Pseudomonas aeruginosa]|uniref:hypothetical protein n=1 Tax=Pseudomonas aeruginosa TaxID=287 RepID=UPI003D27B7C9
MPTSPCPPDLGPEEIVRLDDESLSLPSGEVKSYLRERMTEAQITAEIEAIGNLAVKRSEYGVYGLLGLQPIEQAYSCIYSGESLLNWMHEHERRRMHFLKLALPSAGEQAEAARTRIKARISARKGRTQTTSDLHTAGSMYSGDIDQQSSTLCTATVAPFEAKLLLRHNLNGASELSREHHEN